jgi:hypothetical protein
VYNSIHNRVVDRESDRCPFGMKYSREKRFRSAVKGDIHGFLFGKRTSHFVKEHL